MQCSLEYTTLRKVTQATEIYYDPDVEVRRPAHTFQVKGLNQAL